MVDAVNLVLGCLAIVLSVISIVVSLIYSSKASSTLDKVKEKADAIERDVRERLDDLVRRAAPSEQERALSGIVPDFFKALFANPDLLKKVVEKALEKDKNKST